MAEDPRSQEVPTQSRSGPPSRVDLHGHYLPADYRRAVVAAGHVHPDGMPELPEWSEGAALAMMDQLGIRTTMLSISSPGVHFGDDASAAELARSVNEQGAAVVGEHPDRFGLFAALPLPDIDGAVREAAYALDELGADGVTVETNHDGIHMGDPYFDPLFAQLDRRRAIVFMHPTSPHCAGCSTLAMGQPRPVLEFMFEVTRAVPNMVYQRTLRRFPGIRLIVSHAGAAMPVLADRIADQAELLDLAEPLTRDEVFTTLRRFHYDMAGSPLPRLARALLSIADPRQIHYGSDWPFTPVHTVQRLADALDDTDAFDDSLRRRIMTDNALALFPRLAG